MLYIWQRLCIKILAGKSRLVANTSKSPYSVRVWLGKNDKYQVKMMKWCHYFWCKIYYYWSWYLNANGRGCSFRRRTELSENRGERELNFQSAYFFIWPPKSSICTNSTHKNGGSVNRCVLWSVDGSVLRMLKTTPDFFLTLILQFSSGGCFFSVETDLKRYDDNQQTSGFSYTGGRSYSEVLRKFNVYAC